MTEYYTPEFVDASWTPENSMIKVVGVGGGGCNAVNYMYNQGIKGCSFLVCNTDSQALAKSNVPLKIQLGPGLGAGTDPTKARNAALESQNVIKEKLLGGDTQMLFITAGLGGGTGTGASPVIAKMAKDKGILTVAVVTIPFKNEGSDFLSKAVDGIHELEKNVDSLLIINNEKLYEHFGSELVQDAYPKADEILATAVRGIIEIITVAGYVNTDFEDVKTIMKNSGMALMGSGKGSGPNRIEEAVKGALESPLLNDFDLSTSKNLLMNITAGRNEQGISMKELNLITDKIRAYTGDVNKLKRGVTFDDSPEIGDTIKVTAIATGFKMNLIEITGSNMGKLIMIDKEYKYQEQKQESNTGEISLSEDNINIIKIGFSSSENKRRFRYDSDNKPCLIIEPGQDKSRFEAEAAIRRVSCSRSKTD